MTMMLSIINFLLRLDMKSKIKSKSSLSQKQSKEQQPPLSSSSVQLLQLLAENIRTQNQPEAKNQNHCSTAIIYTKYIWQSVLQDMRASQSQLTPSQHAMLLQQTLPPTHALLTHTGWVLLCETLLSQFVQNNKNHDQNSPIHVLSQYIHTMLQSSTDPSGSQTLLGVLQWTTNNNTNDKNQHSQSPETLSALLQTWNKYQNHQNLSLLEHVAIQLLLPNNQNNNDNSNVSQRLVHLLHHVLQYQQQQQQQQQQSSSSSSLSNIPATLTVPLVWTVWQQNPLLAMATSLVAQGHADWRHYIQESQQQNTNNTTTTTTAPSSNNDTDSDSDSDDHVRAPQAQHYHTSSQYSSASGMMLRVTQQDILTTAKLERLVTNTRQSWMMQQRQQYYDHNNTNDQQQHSPSLDDTMDAIAQILGKATLWKTWGHALLLTASDDDSTATRAYIWALSVLLQGTHAGLYSRTSAASPLLTQLAFDTTSTTNATTTESSLSLTEVLWKFVRNRAPAQSSSRTRYDPEETAHTMLAHHAWSVLCDIFAQQLIALRDNDFLQTYTVPPDAMDTGSSQRTILAEQVILQLKDVLYELYWGRPVVAQEARYWFLDTMAVQNTNGNGASNSNNHNNNNNNNPLTHTDAHGLIPCVAASRARAFLSGTKLWNSLYERWCRLVRKAPFCDESAFLFPTMTTLVMGDGVVRPNDNTMNVDDDDNSDDDMSMEEDEVQRDASAQQETETDALAGAFQDPKMARILTSIPQCLPFERRVKLFHSLLQVDRAKTQSEQAERQAFMLAMMRGEEFDGGNSRVSVEIRRDNLYHDSMRQLNQLGPKLKKKVKVSFINQHGTAEAGIDGGGVFKEFLDDLIKDAFSPPSTGSSADRETTSGLQLFAVTPLETLMVNHHYAKDATFLPHYEFLGRAVGKAVYESILVEPQFCLPFLNTMLGKSNTLEDLKNFDPDYYSSLVKMMNMSRSDIASTGLTFEVNLNNDQDLVELVPGGANKNVTKDNVIQYAHLISHRLLNVQTAPQIRAFLRGFRDLIPAAWVRLFAAHELQKVISGDDTVQGIDVSSFQKAIVYAGGYHESQPVIQDFWEVIHEMTAEQQCKFLKFMTSCSRQPLLGFASLDPVPCTQQVNLPDSLFLKPSSEIAKETPLPTSATCMNLLKLPNYRNKELLRQKLLASIEAGAGFELS